MPFAVTHVILTIVLVDLYRDYFAKHKRYFTLHTIMIAGFAALLPDIDIVINWILTGFGYSLEILQHGGLTHTAFFSLVFLIPAFILLRRKKHKTSMYFLVVSFGILFHVFLDYLLGGGAWEGVMWLWPLSTQAYKIHLLSNIGTPSILLALDAVILLAWLWHEETKHKIKDFI
jgi:membrane-bound metal-dependent hydrolase YbcI (DUF457 family)